MFLRMVHSRFVGEHSREHSQTSQNGMFLQEFVACYRVVEMYLIRYWFGINWFGSPDSVLFDSDLLIRYSFYLVWLIRYCVSNRYILTLWWDWWRHRCVQSTNLLTPIEILIHWAQWSCSCYTSLLCSPGCSLLECCDAWHILGALLLGCSKMQGCHPIYANDCFTTRTVSSSLVLNLSLMNQMN